MNTLTQFASTEAASGGLFEALGIDVSMLIFQAIAFGLLVFVLGKWIYPVFMKVVDERQEKIEASLQAAEQAEKQADAAQGAVSDFMKEARKEANDIVATAKLEAIAAAEAADAKSKAQAERIVAEAHEQMNKDIAAAKKALHNETLSLVALATEKVIGATVSAKVDDDIIAAAIKKAK